jgi:hypothetical protein
MSDPALRRRWPFSLRMLFAAMTIGIAIGGFAVYMWLRAASLHQRSLDYSARAYMFWQVIDGINRMPTVNAKQATMRDEFRAKFDHYMDQSEKCEYAVWRPWLAVDDDPTAH